MTELCGLRAKGPGFYTPCQPIMQDSGGGCDCGRMAHFISQTVLCVLGQGTEMKSVARGTGHWDT